MRGVEIIDFLLVLLLDAINVGLLRERADAVLLENLVAGEEHLGFLSGDGDVELTQRRVVLGDRVENRFPARDVVERVGDIEVDQGRVDGDDLGDPRDSVELREVVAGNVDRRQRARRVLEEVADLAQRGVGEIGLAQQQRAQRQRRQRSVVDAQLQRLEELDDAQIGELVGREIQTLDFGARVVDEVLDDGLERDVGELVRVDVEILQLAGAIADGGDEIDEALGGDLVERKVDVLDVGGIALGVGPDGDDSVDVLVVDVAGAAADNCDGASWWWSNLLSSSRNNKLAVVIVVVFSARRRRRSDGRKRSVLLTLRRRRNGAGESAGNGVGKSFGSVYAEAVSAGAIDGIVGHEMFFFFFLFQCFLF